MLGFCPFASAPFASTGGGAVVSRKAYIIGEAMLTAKANAIWNGDITILGIADVTVMSTIAGSGWVRQNPNTDEWDYKQSSDWNTIK